MTKQTQQIICICDKQPFDAAPLLPLFSWVGGNSILLDWKSYMYLHWYSWFHLWHLYFAASNICIKYVMVPMHTEGIMPSCLHVLWQTLYLFKLVPLHYLHAYGIVHLELHIDCILLHCLCCWRHREWCWGATNTGICKRSEGYSFHQFGWVHCIKLNEIFVPSSFIFV